MTLGDIARPECLLRGVDSLYMAYFLDRAASTLDLDDIAMLKDQAKEARSRAPTKVRLGTETFAVQPYGRNRYAYVLSNRAFDIQLAERMQPNFYVQYSSEGLWTHGLDGATRRFDDWIQSLGLIPIRREKVSRADWAFDYHLPAIDFSQDDFVSRADKDAQHREHGKTQTFTFGRNDVVLRIYDKIAEIDQQSGKAWFFELWGRKDAVWRVEFQLRGERLEQGGIYTLDDLRVHQGDLLAELARNHTALRRPSPGDGNRSRWPFHPLWSALLADIASMPRTGLVRDLDRDALLEWRLNRLMVSLYGTLKGHAAVLSMLEGITPPIALPDLLERLPRLLEPLHSDTLWRNDVAARIALHDLGKW